MVTLADINKQAREYILSNPKYSKYYGDINMTSDEFDTLKADTTEQRDLQIRQVANGFVLVGNRRFLDNGTMTQRFSLGVEGVAETGDAALAAIQRFYTTGDLSGQST